MPHKLCIEERCPEPASYRGRCFLHAKERDRTIVRSGRKEYNTKRWGILRRRVLYEQPVCGIPECKSIATDVDHRIALADGGGMWDRHNLWGLCTKHHAQKTRQEQLTRTS